MIGFVTLGTNDLVKAGAFCDELLSTFGARRVMTEVVSITLRSLGSAAEVDLHQTNCATEHPARVWQHLSCESCWIYLLTNFRSVLAGGLDIRDFAHPHRTIQ